MMSDRKEEVEVRVYPIYTLRFWLAYGVQMRPYLLFLSGIAGLAGIAIGFGKDQSLLECLAVFIPLFLGYGFGQALTDCFQTDTDKLSSPYRPLSKGILSVKSVLLTSSIGLVAIAVVLYLFNPISFLLSLLAVAGLASYSYSKKHFWFGGPPHNAWIMALLPVIGYFAITGSNINGFPHQYYSHVAITFFSYASFVVIGYLKDIEADRATSYKTFPVVFGWTKTIWLGDMIAVATCCLFWYRKPIEVGEIIYGIAGTLFIASGQLAGHFVKEKNEKEALIPILSTVRSFILLHIALALHLQPDWIWLLTAYYLLFEITLYLRPSRYQV